MLDVILVFGFGLRPFALSSERVDFRGFIAVDGLHTFAFGPSSFFE